LFHFSNCITFYYPLSCFLLLILQFSIMLLTHFSPQVCAWPFFSYLHFSSYSRLKPYFLFPICPHRFIHCHKCPYCSP
jgi:hypothetical protein